MTDVTIEADKFGTTVEKILEKLGSNVKMIAPSAVEDSLQVGEKAWKSNARSVLSSSYSRGGWGKRKQLYTKSGRKSRKVAWYGKTIRTGKYARSISHHILTQGGDITDGEIGSASMPGLAHLLEKGHALLGGGSARAFVHIEPASEVAFAELERLIDRGVERAINDI